MGMRMMLMKRMSRWMMPIMKMSMWSKLSSDFSSSFIRHPSNPQWRFIIISIVITLIIHHKHILTVIINTNHCNQHNHYHHYCPNHHLSSPSPTSSPPPPHNHHIIILLIIITITSAAKPGLLCDPSVEMWKRIEDPVDTKFANFSWKIVQCRASETRKKQINETERSLLDLHTCLGALQTARTLCVRSAAYSETNHSYFFDIYVTWEFRFPHRLLLDEGSAWNKHQMR